MAQNFYNFNPMVSVLTNGKKCENLWEIQRTDYLQCIQCAQTTETLIGKLLQPIMC